MNPITYIAAGIMLGFASLAAAIGIGLIGSKYLDGIIRDETAMPTLRAQFFLVMGLVDALPVITLAMGLYLIFAID